MLLTTIHLALLSTVLAQSSTPTSTSIDPSLIPPYPNSNGSATYFASIASLIPDGTIYAITCIAPSSSTSIQHLSDPCLTSSLGTTSQTFTQGDSTWQVDRGPSSTRSRALFYTSCERGLHDNCWARDQVTAGQTDAVTRSGSMAELGLASQAVTVTAGWEKLGDPGASNALPSATAIATNQFTDIGASKTSHAPVTTVTLTVIDSGAGKIGGGMRSKARLALGVAGVGAVLGLT